jgi:N-acetyl sugar amidotransferase
LIYCRRCVYPANHPLGLTFDESGVCSGCRVHEEKDSLDWTTREMLLKDIFDGYRDRSGGRYDCIVPVSGARDSFFIVDLVRRKYGMTPLLVSYNAHYNTRLGIRNLARLRTLSDGDFVQQVIQPQLVRRIMRQTLRTMGSFHWHALAGQTVYPVQIAVRMKIPLIVWGAHQGCDQVGMFSHLDEVEMTRKYRCEHDLMGFEAEDLVGGDEKLAEREMLPYFYPHDREIERVGVRGIYLSNYVRWDSKAQHEAMLDRYGYETADQQRTFDRYNDVDSVHYSGAHDWIKFMKWGYGKATDHAAREIRLRRMTRAEGIAQAMRHAQIEPSDLPRLLEFVDMTRAELNAMIDPFRDPAVWTRKTGGAWELRHSVADDPATYPEAALVRSETCEFRSTPIKASEPPGGAYTLLHPGWVHEEPVRAETGGRV